jgi:hypothetical protein
MSAAAVLRGEKPWHVEQADCLDFLRTLPEDSVDLLFCSPPYQDARIYHEKGQKTGIARGPDEWVAWMLEVCEAASRVCCGLCACVVEGRTKAYRYSCTPFLLLADLHRRGFNLRKPPIYRRVGIPGSGGPDWLRNDYEPIICFTRKGKLPWSDPVACGHPPLYGPGGEMSNRTQTGRRVNQWGGTETSGGNRRQDGSRQRTGSPSHEFDTEYDDPEQTLIPGAEAPSAEPSRNFTITRERAGMHSQTQPYAPPVLANPGNVIDAIVGGGTMGSALCHENEAPFPESLAEFFVLTFCPPGGIVCDPFVGSGTTAAVALRNGRRAIACDLRQSQVELSCKRISAETPSLFGE